MVYVSLAFFTAGSIIAALSNNFTLLLVGRCLQGVGSGGIVVVTEVIVTDLVDLDIRAKWQGFISGMWAIGSVTGPIIGGAFAQNVSWRWIFWINLPIIGLGLLLITLFLTQYRVPGSIKAKLARVDWFGAVLFIASSTSMFIPITWGGVSYPWNSWDTLVPLFVGAAGMVTFVFWEINGAKEPMVPLDIFSNWTLRITYFQSVIHGMILWSLLYVRNPGHPLFKDVTNWNRSTFPSTTKP